MSIKRIDVGARMSQAVVHNGTVYTAGQVAIDAPGGSIADQTANILSRIDDLLAKAGTDKSKLISATIWLTDMRDFAEMNGVWDKWVVPGATPGRACVESRLATQLFNVEIGVIAAVD
jgi:enamine deaminase RidA (YjgF/YER057c/UK114 family)